MKKIVLTIIALVIALILTTTKAESNNFVYEKEEINNKIYNQFEIAINNGKKIDEETYLYNKTIFINARTARLDTERYNLKNKTTKEMENVLGDILHKEINNETTIQIIAAGYNTKENKTIYLMTIKTNINMNQFVGEQAGTGYIADNITYSTLKILFTLY